MWISWILSVFLKLISNPSRSWDLAFYFMTNDRSEGLKGIKKVEMKMFIIWNNPFVQYYNPWLMWVLSMHEYKIWTFVIYESYTSNRKHRRITHFQVYTDIAIHWADNIYVTSGIFYTRKISKSQY